MGLLDVGQLVGSRPGQVLHLGPQLGVEAAIDLALGQVVTAINIINAATVGRPIAREILEVQELEIEQCRRNIQQGLDGLVAAEQTATGTFTAASGIVRYVVNAKFQPVLDEQLKTPPPPLSGGTARRNKLEGAKGEARAGIDPVKPKESFIGSTGTDVSPTTSTTARSGSPRSKTSKSRA